MYDKSSTQFYCASFNVAPNHTRNLMRWSGLPGGNEQDILTMSDWNDNILEKTQIRGDALNFRITQETEKGLWISSSGDIVKGSQANGGSGYGKTSFILAQISDYKMRFRKTNCKAVQWRDFCKVYDRRYQNDGRFDQPSYGGNVALEGMRRADILLIDEIQANLNAVKQELLFELLEDRLFTNTRKLTYFTSNCTFDVFYKSLSNVGLQRRLKDNALEKELYVSDSSTVIRNISLNASDQNTFKTGQVIQDNYGIPADV